MGVIGGLTVVIDEVRDTDSKESTVQARVQACHALPLNDTSDGVVG